MSLRQFHCFAFFASKAEKLLDSHKDIKSRQKLRGTEKQKRQGNKGSAAESVMHTGMMKGMERK